MTERRWKHCPRGFPCHSIIAATSLPRSRIHANSRAMQSHDHSRDLAAAPGPASDAMIMASERVAGLPSWQPTFRFQPKSEYVLSELLRFDDMEFIEVAYRALLHREPDVLGLDDYLNALRGGSASK